MLIAPTINRDDVGEAWVAYQWAHRLSERHDVTLLTYNKSGQVPASEQIPGARVIEWDEPGVLSRAERLNSMLKPGYVPFFLRARRWIKRAHANGERFDIAHQPVPVAMRYPSPVTGLGIPYVIGPVGGSLESPPGFAEDGDTAPWYVRLRSLDRLRMRHDRLLRRTYEEAACVVGIAPYVREFLGPLHIRRFAVMSETGIESLPSLIEHPPGDDVRLLFVGRVVRTKGARDAIRAMSLLSDLPVSLDVVGDGFDRQACEDLVSSLGLSDRVRFHGMVPKDRVQEFYRRADVFVFPSFREPGGNVAFEAMMSGLPLVVCDRGGPGSAVDDSAGIRVKAETPDQLARDVADAVRRLVVDPSLRRSLGIGAWHRAAQVAMWDSRIDEMDKIYEQVIGGDTGTER
jgi:glycosyltransferase involved in cell wall biosynthesis